MAIEGPADQIDKVGPKLNKALNGRRLTRAQDPWSPGAGAGAKLLRPTPNEAVFALDVRFAKGENESTVVPPLEEFVKSHIDQPNIKFYLSGDAPLGIRVLVDAAEKRCGALTFNPSGGARPKCTFSRSDTSVQCR